MFILESPSHPLAKLDFFPINPSLSWSSKFYLVMNRTGSQTLPLKRAARIKCLLHPPDKKLSRVSRGATLDGFFTLGIMIKWGDSKKMQNNEQSAKVVTFKRTILRGPRHETSVNIKSVKCSFAWFIHAVVHAGKRSPASSSVLSGWWWFTLRLVALFLFATRIHDAFHNWIIWSRHLALISFGSEQIMCRSINADDKCGIVTNNLCLWNAVQGELEAQLERNKIG